MAYTGYFGKFFYQCLFGKAFQSYGTNFWDSVNGFTFGSGADPAFDSNGYVTGHSGVAASYATYSFNDITNWAWTGAGSGTGYNTKAVVLTNNGTASCTVASVAAYHLASNSGVAYFKVNPTISLAVGDSLVLPVSGIKVTFR